MANNWVYFMYDPEIDQVKIGQSGNPMQRLASIKAEHPSAEILAMIPAHLTERELHTRFDEYRRTGEWFELTDEIREYIEESQKLPPIIVKRAVQERLIEREIVAVSSPAATVSHYPAISPRKPSGAREVDYWALAWGLIHIFGGAFLVGAVAALENPVLNTFTVGSIVLIFIVGLSALAAFLARII